MTCTIIILELHVNKTIVTQVELRLSSCSRSIHIILGLTFLFSNFKMLICFWEIQWVNKIDAQSMAPKHYLSLSFVILQQWYNSTSCSHPVCVMHQMVVDLWNLCDGPCGGSGWQSFYSNHYYPRLLGRKCRKGASTCRTGVSFTLFGLHYVMGT